MCLFVPCIHPSSRFNLVLDSNVDLVSTLIIKLVNAIDHVVNESNLLSLAILSDHIVSFTSDSERLIACIGSHIEDIGEVAKFSLVLIAAGNGKLELIFNLEEADWTTCHEATLNVKFCCSCVHFSEFPEPSLG